MPPEDTPPPPILPTGRSWSTREKGRHQMIWVSARRQWGGATCERGDRAANFYHFIRHNNNFFTEHVNLNFPPHECNADLNLFSLITGKHQDWFLYPSRNNDNSLVPSGSSTCSHLLDEQETTQCCALNQALLHINIIVIHIQHQ